MERNRKETGDPVGLGSLGGKWGMTAKGYRVSFGGG